MIQPNQPGRPPWLLLLHRLPPSPDYLRVKVRRRLHRIGARPLKNSVYLLPNTDQALEDFAWLRREIENDGGEAMVCEASFVDGLTNEEAHAIVQGTPKARRRRQSDEHAERPKGAMWVTRRGVGVDRIASAWLIRRFVDPKARFKFVAPRGYAPRSKEVRFDMYEGEHTHEGDRCTFETLVKRFALADRALRVLGEIVHDIDCKDAKFARSEAAGVALVIDGIVQSSRDDRVRCERGAALFDNLYTRLRRA